MALNSGAFQVAWLGHVWDLCRLLLSFLAGQAGVKEDAGERFSVKNRPLFDHFEHIRQLHKSKFDLFVVLGMCVSRD
jgi:hypothetical protein